MPKCPNCNEEIDHLHNISSLWHGYDMFLTPKDKHPEYEEYDSWENSSGEVTWNCPECDEDLFWDEDEAIKFLKNQKEDEKEFDQEGNKIKKRKVKK